MREAESDLVRRVRSVVLSLAESGVVILAADVAARVGAEGGEIARVQAALRSIEGSGALAKLGYGRRLLQERTAQGVITMVAWAPRGHKKSEIARSGTPTRAPATRPLGGLEAAPRVQRRVERQVRALEAVLDKAQAEMLRAGEQLLAIEGLVGKRELYRWALGRLGMSPRSARRLMRVALVFGGHPEIERLLVARPSLLVAMADPKFPPERREAILREGGLSVAGRFIALKDLRAVDLSRRPESEETERDQELFARLAAWSAEPSNKSVRARRVARLEALLERLKK